MQAYFILTALAVLIAGYDGSSPFGEPLARGAWPVLGACALVAALYGIGWAGAFAALRRRAAWTDLLPRAFAAARAGAFLLYGFQLYALGWRDMLSTRIRFASLPLTLQTAVLLAPFFMTILAVWAAAYGARAAPRAFAGGFLAFLAFQIRHYATSVLGIFLILGALDLLAALPAGPVEALLGRLPGNAGVWVVYAVLIVGAYLAMPWALRLLWRVRPLPDGDLRARLTRLACAADFEGRRVMLWDTRAALLNACTVGLLPSRSFILLTDALIDRLPPPEVEAVFAHELGHVRGRHFLYYMLYTLLVMTVLVAVDAALLPASAGFWPYLAQNAALVIVVWGGLFGLLSRRLERQADLFAVSLVGDTRRVQGALRRISALGGQPRKVRTLTHGSTEGRIAFLDRADRDPGLSRRLHRTLLWTGIGMAFALAVAFFFVAMGEPRVR